jgi:hypothetical protein
MQEGKGNKRETLTASRGLFNIYKKSTNLHSTRVTGDAASADTAQAFPATPKASTERGSCPPELGLSVD